MRTVGLPTLTTLAVRNLLRHKRRSLVTVCMISVGVAGLMFHRAFAEGSYAQAIHNYTNTATGHFQVYRAGFRGSFDPELFLVDHEALAEKLRQVPGVTALAPRTMAQVLASTATKSQGVLCLGIDPEKEREVTRLHELVVEGQFLESGERGTLLLGKSLAEMLGVRLGEKVVLFTQAYQGVLGAATLRVKGILETGSKQIDDQTVFTSLASGQELLNYTDQISGLVVKLGSLKRVPETAVYVSAEVIPPGYQVWRWDEIAPEIPQWINFFDAIIEVIMLVVLIVIAAGIMNTVLMGVWERTREFGLMMALGTKRYHVVLVVLEEAAFLALLGIALGALLGIAVIAYYHHVGINLEGFAAVQKEWHLGSRIYPLLSGRDLLHTILLLFFDTILFSVYPAWRAARLEPVEAMGHV